MSKRQPARIRTPQKSFNRIESAGDNWRNRYQYLFFCIIVGSGNIIFPVTMTYGSQLTGGGFILMMFVWSLLLGLPLLYMEVFFGRYTRLTNCQMYRIAPISYGLSLTIFMLNFTYQAVSSAHETPFLVNLLKLLVNSDFVIPCLNASSGCYNYKIKGPLTNYTCTYGVNSINCTTIGEIRYPMEYQYWSMYKDPGSKMYPYYQLMTGVFITWGLILFIVMKEIRVLASIVHTGFIVRTTVLTFIFITSLFHNGGLNGVMHLAALDSNQFTLFDTLILIWLAISRLGLVVPSGHMTFSACYSASTSNMIQDCLIIVIGNAALSLYHSIILYSIAGVLGHAMGVDIGTVIVPGNGIYLAMIPEYLVFLTIPNGYLILYYGAIWFFETVKIALDVHMLILNLYDYFPNVKKSSTYVWILTCLALCVLSLPIITQYAATVIFPVIWLMYLAMALGVFISLETTAVSYIYGVERLCVDIQFMTGQPPMKFWKIMWYAIPILGWCNVFIMTLAVFKLVSYNFRNFELETMVYGWLFGKIIFTAMIVIGILATVLYVFFQIGTANLFEDLFKPRFSWGPPEKELRMDRKTYNPHTAIRSQQLFTTSKSVDTNLANNGSGLLLSEFSKNVLQEDLEGANILNDKAFFLSIGFMSDFETTIAKTVIEEST